MGTIKKTKLELKAQREAVRRYERYLPMLQLKKQQLQFELNAIDARIAEKQRAAEQARAELAGWVRLFGIESELPESGFVVLEEVRQHAGNIAGVDIPVLDAVVVRRVTGDLYRTPAWHDDAAAMLERLITLRIEVDILRQQRAQIAEELRTTSQRVNLFDRIKIPESREAIRVIKIFLGDEQAAAVGRAKITKRRSGSGNRAAEVAA